MLEAAIGAVLGAASAILFELLRSMLSKRKKRKEIQGQLRTEVSHLSQYIEARRASAVETADMLRSGKVRPTIGPPPPTMIYKTFLSEIVGDLSPHHLARLSIVYGSVETIHEFLNNTEARVWMLSERIEPRRAAVITSDGVLDCVDHLDKMLGVAQDFLGNSNDPFQYLELRPAPQTS